MSMSYIRGSQSFFSKSPNSRKTQRDLRKTRLAFKDAKHANNQVTDTNLPIVEGTVLFICDPQVDFHKGGKIPVPYSDKISQRIAQLISTYGDSIDEIYVTIQQRPSYHIGHPSFWQDRKGTSPESFVHIDKNDIKKENYLSRFQGHKAWTQEYFEKLETCRFPTTNVIIFPEHCVVGSKGAAVVDSIQTALRAWEKSRLKCVRYVSKGSCSRTEQYSAFQPMVQIKDNDRTQFNKQLLHQLCRNNKVIICGHTLSHSVKYTILDFLKTAPPKHKTALVVLQDLCSTLRDFRNGALHFLETLKSQYVSDTRLILSNSTKLSELFDPSINLLKAEYVHTEVALFSNAQKINYTNSAQSLGGGSRIKNDQFFNFDQNGTQLLGDGCYLIYEHSAFGSLRAIWHRAQENVRPVDLHQLRSCLGFFKPGFGARIPEFKFNNDPDVVLELARDIDKDESQSVKRMFQGILRFVLECRRYNGTFVLKASDEPEDSFLDAGLYGLDSNNNVSAVDAEHFVDPSSFSIISCIPKSARAYKGITKQTVSAFIETGEKLGATIQLTQV